MNVGKQNRLSLGHSIKIIAKGFVVDTGLGFEMFP
jgi:hypothetical protein